jgi:hypothetical protein
MEHLFRITNLQKLAAVPIDIQKIYRNGAKKASTKQAMNIPIKIYAIFILGSSVFLSRSITFLMRA